MAGIYEKHYKWAEANKDHPMADSFLKLAEMYGERPDPCTLALIQCVAEEIEEEMEKVPCGR